MSNWIGYSVSVLCGEGMGHIQGVITETDGGSLTLTKPFRNGLPFGKPYVRLKASHIKSLSIIGRPGSEQPEPESEVVLSTKKRHTVCDNLQASTSCTPKGIPRSKPIDIQNKHTRGNASGNNKRRGKDCCLADIDVTDPAFAEDFDFQTNLALFDKDKLWQEMNKQPDLVRQTEQSRGMYRHDQNVMEGMHQRQHYKVPHMHKGDITYVTDEGRRVPSVKDQLRNTLLQELRRVGLLPSCLTMLARALADLALRLLPHHGRVVALAAADWRGAVAVHALRLLAAHDRPSAALLLPAEEREPTVADEMRLYAFAGGKVARSTAELPQADLLLLGGEGGAGEMRRKAMLYASAQRCGAVLVEPAGDGGDGVRWDVRVRTVLVACPPPPLRRTVLAAELSLPPPLLALHGLQWPADGTLLRLHVHDDDEHAKTASASNL